MSEMILLQFDETKTNDSSWLTFLIDSRRASQDEIKSGPDGPGRVRYTAVSIEQFARENSL